MGTNSLPDEKFAAATDRFIDIHEGTVTNELCDWLEAGENKLLLDHVDALWQCFDQIDELDIPELKQLPDHPAVPDIQRSGRGLIAVNPIKKSAESKSPNKPQRRFFYYAAPAIAASVAFFIVLPLAFFGLPDTYAIAKGSQQTVSLADGSQLIIDSNAKLSVAEGWGRRQVTLEQGSVFFEVTPNKQKPFVIESGTSRITVLGTRFHIYRKGDLIEVTVASGQVNVQDDHAAATPNLNINLSANQRATIDHGAFDLNKSVDHIEVQSVKNSIENDKIQFKQKSLEYVVTRMSDYYNQNVTILNNQHRNIKISGALSKDDFDAYIAILAQLTGFKIERNADTGAVLIY